MSGPDPSSPLYRAGSDEPLPRPVTDAELLEVVREHTRPLDHTEAALIARAFHEAYERLAPEHGYKTREASAVPWEDVPENNRALMVATVSEVLAALLAERETLLEIAQAARARVDRLQAALCSRPEETEARDTYADGFTSGLIEALNLVNDAALRAALARHQDTEHDA